AAFVDTWSLCLQVEIWLKSREGLDRFGEAHPAIVTAATSLRSEIEDLGKLFLKTNQLAEVKQKLEDYAQTHPFWAQREVMMPSRDAKGGTPQFGWLIDLPLSPFRAMQGVDQTAQAVNELTIVAADVAQTAQDLPREVAWETELLLLQTRREVT